MANIQGQLEWKDYLDATLLHLQPSRFAKYIRYPSMVVVGVILVAGSFMAPPEALPYILPVMGAVVFIAAVVVLYRFVLLPHQVKRQFNQQKELHLPFEIEIGDAGLTFRNELGQSTQPWNYFLKWRENERLLILYTTDRTFRMIPKRLSSDPSQIEFIKTHLRNNHIPTAANRRRLTNYIIYLLLFLAFGVMLYIGFRQPVGP